MKHLYYSIGAALTVGMTSHSAHAEDSNNFNKIAQNITQSVSDLPALISAISYLFGLLIGVLGIMKIKDHVENPTQTPLKDGAIRLAAGGALFALPIVFEAMQSTVLGEGAEGVKAAKVNKVYFNATIAN